MIITTQQFLDVLGKEFQIIRHLASKLQDSDLDYRPTIAQRSTMELLRYLSFLFSVSTQSIAIGSNTWEEAEERSKTLTFAEFDSVMGEQELQVHKWFNQLSPEQLQEEVDFWGVEIRSMHFMNMLRWASAYKMQLFLYMKASGHSELNTMNVWAGMDGGM